MTAHFTCGRATSAIAHAARRAIEPLEQRLLFAGGDLDPSFGDDGRVIHELPANTGLSELIALPGGKFLAAGNYVTDEDSNFHIARYNADGTLDTTFGGGDGFARAGFGQHDTVHALAVDDDGKILLAGRSGNRWAFARFNANGKIDNTFSGDGKRVIKQQQAVGNRVHDVDVDADGNIVAVGTLNEQFTILRFVPKGKLDQDFGDAGLEQVGAIQMSNSALRIDGRSIVAAGGFKKLHVVTIDADGTATTTPAADALDLDGGIADITFDGEGRIAVVGEKEGLAKAILVNESAEAVDAFGTGGVATIDNDGSTQARAVLFDADGKLVIGGKRDDDFFLTRLNADGQLDAGFGTAGVQSTDFADGDDSIGALVIDPDGRIIAGGEATTFGSANYSFSMAAYDADGQLDATFGDQGLVALDAAGTFGTYEDLLVLGDGKILALGTTLSLHTGSDFVLARYNADGSRDLTFGDGDGFVVTDFGATDRANRLAVDPNTNDILVLGDNYDGTDHRIAMARYTADGELDAAFDGDGKLLHDLDSVGNDILVRPGGEIVIGGSLNSTAAIIQFNPDGTADNDFDNNGRATFEDFGSSVFAIALESSGDLIATSSTFVPALNENAMAVWRLDDEGAVDTSFSTDGVDYYDVGEENAAGRRIAVQGDGKIVVAGLQIAGGSSADAVVVLRYNTDGTRDNTFGDSGVAWLQALGYDHDSLDMVLQNDGRILLAAQAQLDHPIGTISGQMFLLRLETDGDVDTTFADLGLVYTDAGHAGAEARPTAVAISDDGDYLVAYDIDEDDALSIAEFDAADSAASGRTTVVEIDGTDGDDVIEVSVSGADLIVDVNGVTQTFTEAEVGRIIINGDEGNDEILLAEDIVISATLIGGDGDDTLGGAANDDYLTGGEGNDSLAGRAGNDTVFGGDDNDTLRGGAGDDLQDGGSEDDRFVAGDDTGADTITGDSGTDIVDYRGRSEDLVVRLDGEANDGAANENDNVSVENVRGGSGDDRLVGDGNVNLLYGHAGADTLTGNAGADTLRGHKGADRFFAVDATIDSLFGGTGEDEASADEDDVLTSVRLA